MFKKIGTEETSNILAGSVALVNIILLTISLTFANRIGRKFIWVSGCFVLSLVLLGVGVFSYTENKIMPVILIFVYIFFFSITLAHSAWTIIAETVHSKLLNICVGSHWVFALIIAQCFPICVKYFTLGGVFFAMGALTLVNTVVFAIWGKETRGLTKQTIYRLYMSSKSIME